MPKEFVLIVMWTRTGILQRLMGGIHDAKLFREMPATYIVLVYFTVLQKWEIVEENYV